MKPHDDTADTACAEPAPTFEMVDVPGYLWEEQAGHVCLSPTAYLVALMDAVESARRQGQDLTRLDAARRAGGLLMLAEEEGFPRSLVDDFMQGMQRGDNRARCVALAADIANALPFPAFTAVFAPDTRH